MILHDAATLFATLIDRAVLAVQLLAAGLAFVACVVGPTAVALAAPRARTARPTTTPPPAPARRRPVPSWAHTEPYDYDEAA